MTQTAGKKCSENASNKVQNSKIFYSEEGDTPSPATPSPAGSSFMTHRKPALSP